MKMSMQRTLLLFAVGLASFPVLAMALLIWIVNSDIRKIAETEFDKIGIHAARRMAEDTVRICSIVNSGQSFADRNAREAVVSRLAELGQAKLSDATFTARVINEYDMRKISDPQQINYMTFGQSAIKPYVDGESGRIIDSTGEVNEILAGLKRDTDMDFSVYTRINAAGDMLKVASTVPNAFGGTRVGTFIPAAGGFDDGEIVRALLSKNGYTGVSYVDRKNYMTTYEPIVGADGKVIGAISLGRAQSSFSNILKYFEGMRLGVNGYVWGVDLVRPGESVVRISKDGKLNDTVVEKDPIETRRAITVEILSAAREAGDGKISVRGFKQPGNTSEMSDVIVAYTYFKPWNMVFCATVDKGDYADGVENISEASGKFLLILVPLALVMLVFAGMLAKFAASRGTEMVDELINAANLLKFGDIRAAKKVLRNAINSPKWSNREIYNLAASIKKMSASLSELVSKVQVGGVNLASGAEKIAAGAADIESIADRRSGAVAEVSATVRSIAKSVEILNADAREAGSSVDSLLGIMRDSGGAIERINGNAKGIFEATESVALRLAIILEKTENMAAAISTITAVSERTNMLTLNASLEAERAGEFGEGFALVSAEIGRLADRSAVSALRVSRLVSVMRASVASGISEMEQFTAHMRDSIRTIKMLSENLGGAASQVSDLGSEFDAIGRGVSSQAESAVKISVSVHELNSAAFQTRSKSAELKLVTAALESTSEELRTKVSQFKVPDDDFGA